MALKSLGHISGRLHFLAQNQVTAQAVKQFIPKKIIEEILLYDHKVICQDVFQKDPRNSAERAKRNPWGYICPGAISGVKGQYQSVSAQPPNRFTLYINQNHLFLISSLYQDSGFHRHYETLTIHTAPKWPLL